MGLEARILESLLKGKGLTPGMQRAIDENDVRELQWEIESILYSASHVSTLPESTSGELT